MMFAGVVKRIITMVTAAEMLQESLALLFLLFCCLYADMKFGSLIAKMVHYAAQKKGKEQACQNLHIQDLSSSRNKHPST